MSTNIRVRLDRAGVRYVRPYLGTDRVTGRVIRPYYRFPGAKTDEEAIRLAKERLARDFPTSEFGTTGTLGVELDRYVTWCEECGKSANTVKSYRTHARRCGRLLAMPAARVRASDVERLYHHLLAPKERGGRGLSTTTVIAMHWYLSGAFGWMARRGKIASNPVADVDPPSPGDYEATALEDHDLAALSDALAAWREMPAGSRGELVRREVAFAAHLALNTGMRVGEVCGLRKCDVSPSSRVVHVRGTMVEVKGGLVRQTHPKGKKSRNVSLDESTAEAIRDHERAVCASMGRAARASKEPLVTVDGSHMRPSEVSRTFRTLCEEHGMPRGTTFHSLRHTHATWLLKEGVDMRTVSERLGHSSVATTLKIYAHVLPGRDAQAAETFARAAREVRPW